MAGQKRGFGRERHNAMKLAVAAASVCGFAATWYALGQGHPPLADASTGIPASATPVATSGASPAVPTGTASSTQPTAAPAALPTRRARTSRGS
jgi:hypothetical protein